MSLRWVKSELHYPPDTSSGGNVPPIGGQGKEDIIEFLGEDDKEEILDIKPKTKETKEDDEEEELETKDKDDETEPEDDELKEIEEELEGPTEEQLELMTPVRRGEILKKYPNVFKDFPYLERAYYREQQFTELLPTIEDARTAVEKSQTLDHFEQELLKGSTEKILQAVKSENPAAFAKIADDYLATLSRVDEQAYHVVLGNTIKHTIVAMIKEARASNNEVLQSAAQVLNQFVFGSSKYEPPVNLNRENPMDTTKETEISQRERALTQNHFESTRDDLNVRVYNTLKATIEGNIDPKDSMGDYVKKTASKEALETLRTLIDRDMRFRSLLDRLWEDAFSKRFSKDSTDRIRSAYLSKAKTLLPSVIKKARNEALRGTGKRVREEDDSPSDKKGPLTAGRPQSQPTKSGKISKPEDIPKGMKTIDFLMSD